MCLSGVILGIKAATTGQKVTVVEMALSTLIFGTVGFTIGGYRVAHHRWLHLSMVAIALWIASLPNIWFGFTPGQWTSTIFPTFAIMGVGGWLSTCLKMLEQTPENLEVYYHLGEAHRLAASYPKQRAVEMLSTADIQRGLRLAAKAYTQALQHNPQYAEPHRGLGLLYQQQGLRDLARGELETYLQLKPEAEDRRIINRHLAELSR